MPKKDYRPGAGRTSRTCPDCGGRAALATARALCAPSPSVQHEPTCPIRVAAARLYRADDAWLLLHPDEPVRVRHLHPCEWNDMTTALGREIPKAERRRWCVAVRRAGGGLARYYALEAQIRVVQVSHFDAAGVDQ